LVDPDIAACELQSNVPVNCFNALASQTLAKNLSVCSNLYGHIFFTFFESKVFKELSLCTISICTFLKTEHGSVCQGMLSGKVARNLPPHLTRWIAWALLGLIVHRKTARLFGST
jgi:hypothetical protein